MESKKVFEVPAVYKHDRAENLRLVLENLSRLERITNKIFGNVEKQIEGFQTKLINIQDRTRSAKRLVDALKHRKQATTVFSPSVLPRDQLSPPKLFQKEDQIKYQCFKIVPDPVLISSDKLTNPMKEVQDKFAKSQQLQQKKMKKDRRSKLKIGVESTKMDEYCSEMGLGEIPDGLSTVSSLLVFNSNSNCYVNYDSDFDALQGENATKDDDERDTGGIDEPPPPSLTGKVKIFEYENVTIGYKPQVKELPKFSEVGLGLDNVADVTSWGVDFKEETSIIPSSHLPNLPPVQKDENAPAAGGGDEGLPPPGVDGTAPAPPPPDMGGLDSVAPPPPPPVMGDDVLSAAAPPPPPPIAELPSTTELEEESEEGGGGGGGGSKPEPPGERMGLLAAIRNFKKTNLAKVDKSKHVTRVNVGRKKKAGGKKKSAPTLLEQLRARIAIRRDAMEGKSKKKDDGGGGGGGDDGSFGRERIKRPDLSEDDGGGGGGGGGEEEEEAPAEPPDDDGGFNGDDDDGSDWSDED